jgi:hypothetical protein
VGRTWKWLVVLAVFAAAPVHSQSLHAPESRIGIRLGYWHSNLTINPLDESLDSGSVGSWDGRLGGGLFAMTPLSSNLALQIEALYCRKGTSETVTVVSGDLVDDIDGKITLAYISVPLLVKYTSGPGGFLATAGISLGVPLKQTLEFEDQDIGFSQEIDTLDRADVCTVLGLGFDLDWGQVELRYEHGIRNLDQPGLTRVRSRSWSFLTGFFF